jgi:5'-nucleotidase
MKFLVCNDDGYLGEGIHILVKHLSKYGDCFVVTPDRERSCSSQSMTLKDHIFLTEIEIPFAKKAYKITGLPSDCARIGLHIFKDVDIVFSGVNSGNNLGTDIIYSGTIGAATEALIQNYKSVAIPTDFNRFEIVKNELDDVLKFILEDNFDLISENYILNINFPDRKFTSSKGIKYTFQGKRLFSCYFDISENNELEFIPKSELLNNEEDYGSDCYWHNLGYTTFSPIGLDRTNYKILNKFLENDK